MTKKEKILGEKMRAENETLRVVKTVGKEHESHKKPKRKQP